MPIETHEIARRNETAESVESRNPRLSVNQIDLNDFRNIPNYHGVRSTTDLLPRLELLDVNAGSNNFAGESTDRAMVNTSRDRSASAGTDATLSPSEPESALRRQIASDYASPAMADRSARFTQDMEAFNSRARASGMNPQEVSDTYRQIGRILDAGPDARLSQEQRFILASQVMHNAADPTQIRQNENTCNVTALEVRTYMRQPSAAAALVADVATRGSFVGHDGTTVRLDNRSLTPSAMGTINLNEETGRRSFASQIFQVAAANIANIRDPDFRGMRYEQRVPAGSEDTGEALIDTRTGRVEAHEPGAAGRPNGLINANESITGRREDAQAFMINLERQGRTATRANTFDSAEQLGQRLETLSRAGQLPAVLFVHANSDLFPHPPGEIPSAPFEDGHFISVTGYDPATRTVRYDDQYGPASDHNDRPVPLQSLYNATHVVRANQFLNRLENSRDSISQTDFARRLESLTRSYAERWQTVQQSGGTANSLDVQADRNTATDRIRALARSLPEPLRLRVEGALVPQMASGK